MLDFLMGNSDSAAILFDDEIVRKYRSVGAKLHVGERTILVERPEGSFEAYMWQTLETKARFIQQVMSGRTSVRTAEDLEGGALTYAEIKAIASGDTAVMEKVKIAEFRKLDQLRAVHLNQQHSIRWQLCNLPEKIEDAREMIEHLHADIATRDAHDAEGFTMTVGKQMLFGTGAREEAAKALVRGILSRRDELRTAAAGKFQAIRNPEPGQTRRTGA